MITYKNYTLNHEPNDLLMNLPTGSIDTAENWLAEAPDWEDGAQIDLEESEKAEDVDIYLLNCDFLKQLVEEHVQAQLDNLLHVDAEGESFEEDWGLRVILPKSKLNRMWREARPLRNDYNRSR